MSENTPMQTKVFEIRDRDTFMPVIAIRLEIHDPMTNEARLLRRAGYAAEDLLAGSYVLLITLARGNGRAICDPYDWGGTTLPTAHLYIAGHWDELTSGQVIDAEFIRGESAAPKLSERLGLGGF